jgi:hypothetical protein
MKNKEGQSRAEIDETRINYKQCMLAMHASLDIYDDEERHAIMCRTR